MAEDIQSLIARIKKESYEKGYRSGLRYAHEKLLKDSTYPITTIVEGEGGVWLVLGQFEPLEDEDEVGDENGDDIS